MKEEDAPTHILYKVYSYPPKPLKISCFGRNEQNEAPFPTSNHYVMYRKEELFVTP